MERFFNPRSAETERICFDIFCRIARPWDYFFLQQLCFLVLIIFFGEIHNSQGGGELKEKE